jgi:hypothetical protein
MKRLERKPIRVRSRSSSGRGVRLFSAVLVGIAASSVGIAVLADRSAEMIHDGVWTTVDAAPAGWPDEPFDVAVGPLGRPPAVTGPGTFAYLATQDDAVEPVAYSPCQPIHLVVNPRRAVAGHDDILADAVAEVSRATGLKFVFDGETDRVPARRAPQPAMNGRGWEPVLVAWSDEQEVQDLAGNTAGLGGSAGASRSGHEWLVTGSVVLDGADLAEIIRRPNGRDAVRAIVMHEFGHLLGLNHVQAAAELMNDDNVGQREFGPGDRVGLAKLGSGRCVDW